MDERNVVGASSQLYPDELNSGKKMKVEMRMKNVIHISFASSCTTQLGRCVCIYVCMYVCVCVCVYAYSRL